MTEPFPPPPPDPGQPAYGYRQHGYGYSYGAGPVGAYSGFWRRAGAALLDGFILSTALGLLALLFGGDWATAGTGYGYSPGQEVFLNVIDTVTGVAYYAYLEGTRGQTLGKMILGIRVVDADTGAIIGIPRGIGRYFARILSGLALGLGYLWMLWDPRKQTWHDKIVRSVVVRTS